MKSSENSEARKRLAKLIEERDEAAAEVADAQTAIGKLESIIAAVAPIEGELAMLDANEAEAMSAWSRAGGNARAPEPDSKRRGALQKRLGDARAQFASAHTAIRGLQAQQTATQNRRAALDAEIAFASAEVFLATFGPLGAEAAEAVRQLEAVKIKARAARETFLALAESDLLHPARTHVLRLYETVNVNLSGAFNAPFQDDAAYADWLAGFGRFVAALREDGAAEMEAA